MRFLIIVGLLLVALPLGLIAFLKASPAQMAAILRVLGGGVLLAIGTLLATRGLALVGAPMALYGFLMVARGLGMASGGTRGFGSANRSSGQNSSVRTSMLAMELDHDSGDMDGEVLAGPLAGKRLSELDIKELSALMSECLVANDQSPALLEAYLDRHHPDWHETAGVSEGASHPGTGADAGPMTRRDALETLGLGLGATEEDIRKAHRKLMKKYHPDQGGSDYLAARINQAKDVLLGD
jgi:DnaJ-domain-containing protein 1